MRFIVGGTNNDCQEQLLWIFLYPTSARNTGVLYRFFAVKTAVTRRYFLRISMGSARKYYGKCCRAAVASGVVVLLGESCANEAYRKRAEQGFLTEEFFEFAPTPNSLKPDVLSSTIMNIL